MPTIKEIASAIELFAPPELQESYDNSGLQIGDPGTEVTAALLCLDVTEDIVEEALDRQCNLIITHHPLLFKGLKNITGKTAVERIAIKAIRENLAIYSAHTNLDSASEGISHEMARLLKLKEIEVLEPKGPDSKEGLGVIGYIHPAPKLEFLRKLKETFNVKSLRYSSQSPQLVVRKVAVCGGAGASLIKEAVDREADIIITGDVKYHDFTSFGQEIIIADIGHYESEQCSKKILWRVVHENFPDLVTYFSEKETNPIKIL